MTSSGHIHKMAMRVASTFLQAQYAERPWTTLQASMEVTSYEDPAKYLLKYKGNPDIYISFTSLPKIGINPSYGYSNPIGVYAYPLQTVLEGKAPYAKDRTYLQVLHHTKMGKYIRDLSSLSQTEYKDITSKLGDMFIASKKFKDKNEFLDYLKKIEQGASNKSYGGVLFYLIVKLNNFDPVKQTKTWRTLGYNMLGDLKGDGIIHPNEKEQVVFLEPSAYKHIDMIHKKVKPPKERGKGVGSIEEMIDTFQESLREHKSIPTELLKTLSKYEPAILIKGLKNSNKLSNDIVYRMLDDIGIESDYSRMLFNLDKMGLFSKNTFEKNYESFFKGILATNAFDSFLKMLKKHRIELTEKHVDQSMAYLLPDKLTHNNYLMKNLLAIRYKPTEDQLKTIFSLGWDMEHIQKLVTRNIKLPEMAGTRYTKDLLKGAGIKIPDYMKNYKSTGRRKKV